MYTREREKCPEAFVKNGKPVFGTFEGLPHRLDIRGIKNPYGLVQGLTYLTNLRIKSRVSFFFSAGDYTGCVDFFDAKILGFQEICFWNRKTNQRFVYRNVSGPRRRLVPHDMERAHTASFNKSRYVRISWDRFLDKISLVFNLKGHSVRPSANASFIASFSNPFTGQMTLSVPFPTMQRSSASSFIAGPLHGALTLLPRNSKAKTMEDSQGSFFLEVARSYTKFRTNGEMITGLGSSSGHEIEFRISATSQDSVNPEKYNQNMLFVDGKATPLPPVKITHPYGTMNEWVIQDTEGMVDLTFTPLSENLNTINIIVVRTHYHSIFGNLEGTLMTEDGNKVSFKKLPGIAKKFSIRL